MKFSIKEAGDTTFTEVPLHRVTSLYVTHKRSRRHDLRCSSSVRLGTLGGLEFEIRETGDPCPKERCSLFLLVIRIETNDESTRPLSLELTQQSETSLPSTYIWSIDQLKPN